MKNVKCINCNNHYSHDFKCKLDDSSTIEKKYEEIKDCFVLSDHLKSLDKMIYLTEKMISILP